jgi:ABC-2 type transport system ATP-binding protein
MIAVDGLSKSFGSTRALARLSFRVGSPGVVGILGPNGAGKSTLLAILEGLMSPDEGRVRLFGTELGAAPYPRRRVGVIMQNESVWDDITAAQYADLFAAIYGVAGGRDAILEQARLASSAGVRVANLSGGEAQRLDLAAVSAHEPDLLFLDEPTAHLDPHSRREIGEWLRRMAVRRTILLATHDLREAEAVCDVLIFLVGGQIKAHGTVAELVDRVPPSARTGERVADAFFHFCGAGIGPDGDAR